MSTSQITSKSPFAAPSQIPPLPDIYIQLNQQYKMLIRDPIPPALNRALFKKLQGENHLLIQRSARYERDSKNPNKVILKIPFRIHFNLIDYRLDNFINQFPKFKDEKEGLQKLKDDWKKQVKEVGMFYLRKNPSLPLPTSLKDPESYSMFSIPSLDDGYFPPVKEEPLPMEISPRGPSPQEFIFQEKETPDQSRNILRNSTFSPQST